MPNFYWSSNWVSKYGYVPPDTTSNEYFRNGEPIQGGFYGRLVEVVSPCGGVIFDCKSFEQAKKHIWELYYDLPYDLRFNFRETIITGNGTEEFLRSWSD